MLPMSLIIFSVCTTISRKIPDVFARFFTQNSYKAYHVLIPVDVKLCIKLIMLNRSSANKLRRL